MSQGTGQIRRVAVIGGGVMGGGIAALCARQGLEVVVKEATPELADKARKGILERFQKWHKAGKIDVTKLSFLHNRVVVTHELENLQRVPPDLVIEAIVEKLEAKLSLFNQLDGIMPPETIFASNTSTLPITSLAAATDRADKFVGMHFFNPPTTMQLVEIIPGALTSADTVQAVTEFTRNVLGKTAIRVKDRPGFLVNCLLLPYLAQAVQALQEYNFKLEELDKVATDMGWPMGPYKLLDTVGIDVAYYAGKIVAAARPGLKMPELFEFMLKENRLGDKSGSGFYKTGAEQTPLVDVLQQKYPHRPHADPVNLYENAILHGMLLEAVVAFQDGVASKQDIELGAVLGLGCPKGGPLHIADELGLTENKFFESW